MGGVTAVEGFLEGSWFSGGRLAEAFVETPRGTFAVARGATLGDAQAAGFGLWFEHRGYAVVGDGAQVFAVRLPQGAEP